jgi:hypothetical protein
VLLVSAWLNNHFHGWWIGRRGPAEWPSKSSDHTVRYFFLGGWPKEEAYLSKSTLDELEQEIKRDISAVVSLDVLSEIPCCPRCTVL